MVGVLLLTTPVSLRGGAASPSGRRGMPAAYLREPPAPGIQGMHEASSAPLKPSQFQSMLFRQLYWVSAALPRRHSWTTA